MYVIPSRFPLKSSWTSRASFVFRNFILNLWNNLDIFSPVPENKLNYFGINVNFCSIV